MVEEVVGSQSSKTKTGKNLRDRLDSFASRAVHTVNVRKSL